MTDAIQILIAAGITFSLGIVAGMGIGRRIQDRIDRKDDA